MKVNAEEGEAGAIIFLGKQEQRTERSKTGIQPEKRI
jgi:hypothetical protein